MTQEQLIIITPTQCRAARELLDWSQEDLQNKSRISRRTISNFERANKNEIEEFKIGNILELLKNFRNADIEFINNGEKIGVLLV